jgi:hypothetical protein
MAQCNAKVFGEGHCKFEIREASKSTDHIQLDNYYLSVVSCSMVSLAVEIYRTYDELLDFD